MSVLPPPLGPSCEHSFLFCSVCGKDKECIHGYIRCQLCLSKVVEVRVTDPKTGGEKGQKDEQLGALPARALLEVAKVAGFGARKYARNNYLKGYAWSLSYDALQRHLHLFWAGEDKDAESGLYHLAHAAWHCLALIAFSIYNLGTDDRWRAP